MKKQRASSKEKKVRNAFVEAFERLGGLEGLISWASQNTNNTREFYKMLLNSLPKEPETSGEISFQDKLLQAISRSKSLPDIEADEVQTDSRSGSTISIVEPRDGRDSSLIQ